MTQPQNLAQTLILSPSLQGPPGPSSLTTVGGFTQPLPNGSVTGVTVASTIALTANGPVQISTPTTYYGTYLLTSVVQGSNGAGTVTLQWLSAGGGVGTGVAIPPGASLFPATLPGNGPLGTNVVGGSTYTEDGTDFVAGIAGGQTGTVYTLPSPLLGNGEQVTIGCEVDFQNNSAPLTVVGMTGSGVSPIVVQVASTAGMVTGEMRYLTAVLGNVAANGGWVITVVDGTHFSLNGSTGNGTWTSGGVVLPGDFGTFALRATFRNVGGTLLVNPFGTTASYDVTYPTSNEGVSLAGTSCVIAPANGTIAVKITAPAGVPIRAAGSVSFVRRAIPGAGPLPDLSQAVLSVNHGPSQGGTPTTPVTGSVTLTGGAHLTGAFAVTLCGLPVASFQVLSDSSISFVPASERPSNLGTGDLFITTVNGAGTMSGGWTYDADPYVILAAGNAAQIPKGWWRNDSLQFSGSNVTSWTDLSGNGANLTVLTGTPQYEASSPNITPNGPAMSVTGIQGIGNNAVTFGAGNPICVFVAMRAAGTGAANGVIFQATQSNNMRIITASTGQTLSWAGNGGANCVWGTNIKQTLIAIAAYSQSGTGTETSSLNVGNGTPVTATATGIALPATEIIRIGTDTFSTTEGEYFEVVACNFIPSGTQFAQMEAYFHARYGGTA